MPQPYSPPCVLVIDDDEMSRELLTVLLESEGYTVKSAESGDAALVQLSNSQSVYDVILTDLQMPGTAGAELAKELRRACGTSALLLAMSGSQPPAEQIAPFDGFLLKPFRMEDVAAALLKQPARTRKESHCQSGKQLSRKKREPAVSHQSGTPLAAPNALSLAASAGRGASNDGMNVPIQERRSNEQDWHSTEHESSHRAVGEVVLNEQIYRQLAGSMPTPQLREMYILCINDARQRISAMRKLATHRDEAQFVREAHAIKGGSGMLGATELHRMAAAIETRGLSPKLHTDVNSLDELCAACDRLERMLGSRA